MSAHLHHLTPAKIREREARRRTIGLYLQRAAVDDVYNHALANPNSPFALTLSVVSYEVEHGPGGGVDELDHVGAR